ncbi:MAG: hypothetical protein JWN48_604 [Myxococcaceae bacterium]|nr:hypothetical protein [Myxococcaceae bacterium]
MTRGLRLDLLNGCALLLTLAVSMVGSGWSRPALPMRAPESALAGASAPRVEHLADGEPALRDARAVLVPLRAYRRIASATLVSDRVLADLCEPERIVAFSRSAASTPSAHRYVGKPSLGARDDVERVLSVKPELLIVSNLVDASFLARVEDHGVRVFVLGATEGLDTLSTDIAALGLLIGAPERAAGYARSLRQRLANVAHAVPPGARPRALYLSIYGAKLFAAGAATSYHDVLEFSGLTDAAGAAGLRGWPELSAERVLALDPEVLLTRTGMSALLCRHPGLDRLRPCRGQGRLIELNGALLDDPGPAMLEATEALYEAYWRGAVHR